MRAQVFAAGPCGTMPLADLVLCSQRSEREVPKSSKQVQGNSSGAGVSGEVGEGNRYVCGWGGWMFTETCLWCCRDYTNPYLPVAPSAIDGSAQVSEAVVVLSDSSQALCSSWKVGMGRRHIEEPGVSCVLERCSSALDRMGSGGSPRAMCYWCLLRICSTT